MARFYRRNIFKNNKPYIVTKCTREKGFELIMSETEAEYIVISVLENFLVDAVGEDLTNGGTLADKMIKDFGATLRATAERLPETKFAVVMPIRRPAVEWYGEQMPEIKRSILAMLSGLQMINIGKIEGPLESTQLFEQDGIHLTKDSGENFLGIILERAEDFFSAESIDLTQEDKTEANKGKSQVSLEQNSGNRMTNRIERLEADMREMKRNRTGDHLMFARLREDSDFEKNKQKEDRIVVNQLKVKNVPKEYKVRTEYLKNLATELVEFLVPGFPGKILWVTHGRINEVTSRLSYLEVKLDSVKSAVDIRKAFVQKMRTKKLTAEYENIFITNSVTKATRVRIDILKAIARKITNDKEAAFVSSFISRPVLQIKKIIQGEETFPYKSFTFVEAVVRFRNEIEDRDLDEAYERASVFEAELEQNFLVLTSSGRRNRPIRDRANAGQGGHRGGRGGLRGYDGRWGGRGGRGGLGNGGFGTGNNGNGNINTYNKRQNEDENYEQSTSKAMKT